MASSAKWVELTTFPFKYFAAPIRLNHNEFIVVPDKASDCPSDCLYKYNIKHDKWIKWIKYPKDLITSDYHTAARDEKNRIIYVYAGSTQTILIIHEDDHKCIIHKNTGYLGINPHSIVANNEFHIIGGSENPNHFVWDSKNKKFKIIHEFLLEMNVCCWTLIHIKSQIMHIIIMW